MAKDPNKITEKASFNLRPDIIKKLRYVAVVDETTQTDIVDKLLSEYIEKWQKKHGEIPLR